MTESGPRRENVNAVPYPEPTHLDDCVSLCILTLDSCLQGGDAGGEEGETEAREG